MIQDIPFAQIAREVGYHEKSIGYWANKHGIKRMITWQDINSVHGEEIERLYIEDSKSIEEIHQEFGFAFKTIKKIFAHRNIFLRSRSETVKLSALTRVREFTLNEDYFKKWSSEMAYIVGFINADGNILYNEEKSEYVLQISLHEDDREVLCKIKEALEYEGEIYYYDFKRPNGNFTPVARLAINSKRLVRSLLDIGIEPNKSLIKGVPHKLPEKYIFEYLRGYFDGNGTIDMRYARTVIPSLRLRLTSGSEKHLNEVQDILLNFGFSKKRVENQKGSNTYVLRFGNKETHTLYDRFYHDEECIFMDRKKNKFDMCIQQRILDQENKKKYHKRERGKVQGTTKYV